jgi:hypothetical protein
MPAAIPSVFQLVAATITTGAGLGPMASGLIAGGASLLGGFVAREMVGNKQLKDAEEIRENFVSTERTIPLIYGRRMVGGNIVYAEVAGEGEGSEPTKGNYLWVVYVIGEGEIEGFGQKEVDGVMYDEIYINDRPIWKFNPSYGEVKYWLKTGTPDQVAIPEIEAASRKASLDDKFTDPMRNTAYVLFRYLFQDRKGLKRKFQSVPRVEAVYRGLKCYDPRISATAWTDNPALVLYDYMTNKRYGMGWESTNFDSPSFEESANYCEAGTEYTGSGSLDSAVSEGTLSTGGTLDVFVLSSQQDYNKLRVGHKLLVSGSTYEITELLGSLQIEVTPAAPGTITDVSFTLLNVFSLFLETDHDSIKISSILTVSPFVTPTNYKVLEILPNLELLVTPSATSVWSEEVFDFTHPKWTLNYVVASQIPSQTIIDTVLGHYRGYVYEYNSKIYAKFIELEGPFAETPVLEITDEYVARDDSGAALVSVSQPSMFNTPTGIEVSFVNIEENWVTDRVKVGDTAGTDLVKIVDFVGFADKEMAMEMGIYVLEREKLNRAYTLTLRSDSVALDVNDLVTLTVSELGFTNSLVRVKGLNVETNGLISATFIPETVELYNKEYDLDTSTVYNVDLPSIADDPPPVTGLTVTETTYDYRDRSFIRLNVSFTVPEASIWFSHVKVYLYISNAAPVSEDDYVFHTTATGNFQIDPVEEGTFYYIRLNSVTSYGVEQDNSGAARIGHSVVGVSLVTPTCPTYLNAAVNMDSIDLVSNVIADPDIRGYEIRFAGTAFPEGEYEDAIFLTFNGDPYTTFAGVKPGDHRFWLNTRHKNGNYCTTPVYSDAIIEEPPPGSNEFFNQVVNYSTGTSDNVTVSGTYPEQFLTCTHTGGDLQAIYTSLEIDTGNDKPEMIVYVDFDFWIGGNPSVSVGTLSTGGTLDVFVLSSSTDYDAIAVGDLIIVDGGYYEVETKLGSLQIEVTPAAPATLTNESFIYQATTSGKSWRDLALKSTGPDVWMTWAEFGKDASGEWKTWVDVLGEAYQREAPRIQVEVEYSTSSGGPYTTVERMELLTAVVNGRYVRVKYTIEDNNMASYMMLGPSTLRACNINRTLLIS